MSILSILNFALNSAECPIINISPVEMSQNYASQWRKNIQFSLPSPAGELSNCPSLSHGSGPLSSVPGWIFSRLDSSTFLSSGMVKHNEASWNFEELWWNMADIIEYHEINEISQHNISIAFHDFSMKHAFHCSPRGCSRIGKSLAQYLVWGFLGKPWDFFLGRLDHLGALKQRMVYWS